MQWEYIAGFFDGEGSILFNGKRFRITMAQTNHEVLEQIRVYAGFGNIFKAYKKKAHWKDCWIYFVARQEDVYTFLAKVSPFLIVKRALAARTIPRLKKVIVNKHQRSRLSMFRKREVKKLRKNGLTYREIGKELSIDWGHARRLTLI